MTPERLQEFRHRLERLLHELDETEGQREAQRPVELDQQSVGRLARMDALQNQAMAKASGRRRSEEVRRILSALERIDEGTYGECLECGDDIPERRLEIYPTTPLCVSCAAG